MEQQENISFSNQLTTIEQQLCKIVEHINLYEPYDQYSTEMQEEIVKLLKETQNLANISLLLNEINQKRGVLVKKLFF